MVIIVHFTDNSYIAGTLAWLKRKWTSRLQDWPVSLKRHIACSLDQGTPSCRFLHSFVVLCLSRNSANPSSPIESSSNLHIFTNDQDAGPMVQSSSLTFSISIQRNRVLFLSVWPLSIFAGLIYGLISVHLDFLSGEGHCFYTYTYVASRRFEFCVMDKVHCGFEGSTQWWWYVLCTTICPGSLLLQRWR